MKIYLVGGAVRDHLLGRPIHEKDYVVVGATVAEMLALGFQPVGKDFPVFLHPKTHEEYALARTERSTGRGYTQFEFYADPSVTLENDLRRRDLTINAIAFDEENNTLIDPFGGQQDLHNKILRHVSPAFIEDPVRILRLARFAARYADLGFTVAHETYRLMRHMVKVGEVDALVAERVWHELSLALMETQPQQFFDVLRRCGALAILFPEINHLFGVPNDPHFHPEIDAGEHALLTLQRVARSNHAAQIRFAALMQYVGKSKTPPSEWPHHKSIMNSGVEVAENLSDRYKVPNEYRQLALLAIQYHYGIYQAQKLSAKQLLNLFEKVDAFRRPIRFEELLQVCAVNHCQSYQENEINFPQMSILQEALKVAREVEISDLLNQNLKGLELKHAIREKRVNAIKNIPCE